jgi:CRISPR system Cascade subunit CasC
MFIELHMIQNFAPSNLNRDDTGSPKDCEFGGYRRARISSQCLKRAIRHDELFAAATGATPAVRTRWLTRLLSKPLLDIGKSQEEAAAVAAAVAAEYAKGIDKKNPERTDVLLFLSNEEVAQMGAGILERWDDLVADDKSRAAAAGELVKGLIKQQHDRTSAPDIALFGRMLANRPELGLEASCQVAHAISTHRVGMEMDYFTAVDDVLDDSDEIGAGMIGETSYNSSCFYRYARLDWKQLVANLNGDEEMARKTLEGFLRAAVAAVPSGKQNSMAAHNPPAFILAVARRDGMGWSLANAFEQPVAPDHAHSLTQKSIVALDGYWHKLITVYGDAAIETVAAVSLEDVPLQHLQNALTPNLERCIETILQAADKAGGKESAV